MDAFTSQFFYQSLVQNCLGWSCDLNFKGQLYVITHYYTTCPGYCTLGQAKIFAVDFTRYFKTQFVVSVEISCASTVFGVQGYELCNSFNGKISENIVSIIIRSLNASRYECHFWKLLRIKEFA